MWMQLDEKQIAALTRICTHAEVAGPEGHADAQVILERIAWYNAPGANVQAFRDAVKTSDKLEVDPDAVTSLGDEGAFVMTWAYVTNEEAGITEDDDPDPDACECDNTHEANDTVCRWCWSHGRRKWNDPEVPE